MLTTSKVWIEISWGWNKPGFQIKRYWTLATQPLCSLLPAYRSFYRHVPLGGCLHAARAQQGICLPSFSLHIFLFSSLFFCLFFMLSLLPSFPSSSHFSVSLSVQFSFFLFRSLYPHQLALSSHATIFLSSFSAASLTCNRRKGCRKNQVKSFYWVIYKLYWMD